MDIVERREGKSTFNNLTYKIDRNLSAINQENGGTIRLDFYQNVNGKEVKVGFMTIRKSVGPLEKYHLSNITVLPEFQHRKKKEEGIFAIGSKMMENFENYILLQNILLTESGSDKRAIATVYDGVPEQNDLADVHDFYKKRHWDSIPNSPDFHMYFPVDSQRQFSFEELMFIKKA